MNRLIDETDRVLIIGIGRGDILPYLGRGQKALKIGIDINKKFLQRSKSYCDIVLASAPYLPIKKDSIDLVFFDLVLHHLKGQRNLKASLKEAHRSLLVGGKLIAIEPNSLNLSGLLLNVINRFHLYSHLFGGSNYEYALSPKEINAVLSDFRSIKIEALTLLNPRFPLFIQRYIMKRETFLLRKLTWFAWLFLIIASKVSED
jgi:SAM-dependent methyltransferase